MNEKKSPVSAEEATRLRKEAEESRWETIYMVSAVVGTIFVISTMMVREIRPIALTVANEAPVGHCVAGGCTIRHGP